MNKPAFDHALAERIAECQKRTKKTYRYRRVHLWLEKQEIWCNPKTVLRVMQKYGLLSKIRRRRSYLQMGEHLHKYPNLLDREFTAQRPNQKWVTDISYIHTGRDDLYVKSIVTYETGIEQAVHIILDTLQLHSD